MHTQDDEENDEAEIMAEIAKMEDVGSPNHSMGTAEEYCSVCLSVLSGGAHGGHCAVCMVKMGIFTQPDPWDEPFE